MNIITLPGTIKLVDTQTRQNKMSQKAIFDFPEEQEKWVLINGKLPLIHFADAQYSRIEKERVLNTLKTVVSCVNEHLTGICFCLSKLLAN